LQFHEIQIAFDSDLGVVDVTMTNKSPANEDRTVFIDNIRVMSAEFDLVGEGTCQNAQSQSPPSCRMEDTPENCREACGNVATCEAYSMSVSDAGIAAGEAVLAAGGSAEEAAEEEEEICILHVLQAELPADFDMDKCDDQSSSRIVSKGSGEAPGLCYARHDDGYALMAKAFEDGGVTPNDLMPLMLARGSSLTLDEAKLFVKAADGNGDGQLTAEEVLKGLETLQAKVTIATPYVVTREIYDELRNLTLTDFLSPSTNNRLTGITFAALLRENDLPDFTDDDGVRLLTRMTHSTDETAISFEDLEKGLDDIENLVMYTDAEPGDGQKGGASITAASFGANCDLDAVDNALTMMRVACNGKMLCSFEIDAAQFEVLPLEFGEVQCDREFSGVYVCPNGEGQTFQVGQGCADTGGGTGNICVDADGRTATIDCSGQMPNAPDKSHMNLEPTNDDPGIDGGGWKLVKRVKKGSRG